MATPSSNVENTSTPAVYAGAVTTSDSTNLSSTARALYIGTGGDVVALMPDDSEVTFKNAQSGQILPVRVKRVNATNTTASNIVALY
jgi:hypothetical protein